MKADTTCVPVDAKNTTTSPSLNSMRPLLGFVRRVGSKFGFIQINSAESLFFAAQAVEQPLTIHDLHRGDPVEFQIGQNHLGPVACHVRKMFAFRRA